MRAKTKTMISAWSRTMRPRGNVMGESVDLNILGVIFDTKIIFEKHLCSVSRAASQRLGILKKS